MEKTSETIKNFEELLRNQSTRKPFALYNGIKYENSEQSETKQLTAHDVLSNVSRQLRALQNADCMRTERRVPRNMYKCEKSFVPVNMLQEIEVSDHQTNINFDTQCVSDTQLINIIQVAEALETHKGVTQEFETSFCHTHIENTLGIRNAEPNIENIEVDGTYMENQNDNNYIEEENHHGQIKTAFPIIDISLKETDPNNKLAPEMEYEVNENKNILEENIASNETQAFNSTEMNGTLEIEKNVYKESIFQDIDRPSSPVFSFKPFNRVSTPFTLVFDLEAFEKFENLAAPIVQETSDIQIAKQIINSQLIGKEMCIQVNTEPILNEIDRELSFIRADSNSVIKIEDSIKVVNPEIAEDLATKSTASSGHISNEKFILKDEILFSSDEEEEYMYKNVKGLPFTCVLETSLYEQSEILDKTMYVGFQTASSKSIQICTDSFHRAKSMFDSMTVSEKEPTLTELVEKCDAAEHIYSDMDGFNFLTAEELKSDNKATDSMIYESKDILKGNEIDTNIEFKTANGKSIDVSKDALTKSKTLLQNINIDLPVHSIDSDIYLSQIISKTDNSHKTASNKNLSTSDIVLDELEYQFKEIDFQQVIDLKNLQLDTCNENALEDIRNKITEKIAEGFDNSYKQNHNTKNYETPQLTETSIEPKLDDNILEEFERVEMSQESIDSNKDDSKENPTGFKKANVKKIMITDVAVAKTRSIFQDIDLVKEPSNAVTNQLSNLDNSTLSNETMMTSSNYEYQKQTDIGFKTVSNKQCVISNQTLAETKYIFHDINPVEIKDTRINIESASSILGGNFNHPSTSIAFVGFKTANNKEIKISDEALLKTKDMFQDIEKYDYVQPAESPEPAFRGFDTASNKSVDFSANTFSGSKEIFQITKNDSPEHFLKDLPTNKKAFFGFTTANNNKVVASNDVLETSKKLLAYSEVLDQFDKSTVDFSTDNIEDKDRVPVFKGFQTASMKPVKISAKALAKSKAIFQDVDKEISTDAADDNDILSKFKGFQTASNKAVYISEETLAKSRKIFHDIDQKMSTNETRDENLQRFKRASNKELKIFGDTIAKSRNIFEDIENLNEIIESSTCLRGFQTASNKEVRISEEALAKSRKMLEEFENVFDNNGTATGFKGFQTACNKEVTITKESLAKSRNIFKEIDNCYEGYDALVKKSTSSFKGFQTASNKQVHISEDAIDKSKHLFQDICLDNEICATKAIQNNADIFNNEVKFDIDHLRPEMAKSTDFGFKTANDRKIKVSEKALMKSRQLFADLDKSQDETSEKYNLNKVEAKFEVKTHLKDDINLENIINTQVLSNFEQTLYTEDFCKETPEKPKRSGSPILSCPKAKKKKKFEIPYSQRKVFDDPKDIPAQKIQTKIKNPENYFVFDENYKKSQKYNLKDIQILEKECKNTEVYIDPYILDFEFENLLNFKFSGSRNDITHSLWTVDDLKSHFQDSVNKKFIPDGWIDNHLKLILWKLISYEVKFPNTFANVCTARNVMEQLKYRYDKELYNAERPALRKIMEKDDTSTRTLVLCVVAMFENGLKVSSITNISNNVELLVTDGWYCMKANLDKMLTKLVANGKIVVGSKIATNGAELVNCDQGVSPWEDTSSIRLKLSGNSTRRARWDARLGYHPGAILCPLSFARADGGRVSLLRVVATRVYPALYVERFQDGSTVTRSERLEHLQQARHEADRQALMEKIYEEVEKEFSDQTHLTDTQKSLLQEHTTRKREKLLENIQRRVVEKMEAVGLNAGRNVIRLLKVRVAGIEERGGALAVPKAMLSIWKPTDAVLEMITEGSWIEVMNVVPTAIRYSEIQISAGRQSVFSQFKQKESEKTKPCMESLKRTCYLIKELAYHNPAMTTDYNEIDTVGLICLIEPSIKDFDGNTHQFQNMYLVDADKNIICVNFWGGLKKFGFENVLETGHIVTCMNLQKRAGNTRKNIPQYRVTEFSYFTKTPRNDRARNIADNLSIQLGSVDRRKFCEQCVCPINKYSARKLQEHVTPYKFQNVDVNSTKNRIYVDSPLAQKNDDNLNLTGLDFESTFKQTDTQDLSPEALLRKKRVNEKIAKLKMYGEPPPLSPIHVINTSKNAAKAYKSPLISKSDVSSVAGEVKILPKESEKTTKSEFSSSPIINRTFVKRTNVNPVKLNFENVAIHEGNDSDVTDHFAEDFDASQPLSLD